MPIPWGLVILLMGIVRGVVAPGAPTRFRFHMNGLLTGTVLGLVFAVLGYTMENNPLAIGNAWWSFVLAFVVLTFLFAAGVWLGDRIDHTASRDAA